MIEYATQTPRSVTWDSEDYFLRKPEIRQTPFVCARKEKKLAYLDTRTAITRFDATKTINKDTVSYVA